MSSVRTRLKKEVFKVGLVLFFCLFSSLALAANPSVGTITPSSGTSNPNQTVTFTTTFSDLDGWQNIQNVEFLINTTTNPSNSFYGGYIENTNKLYLRNDANTAWLGGFTPGSLNIIENSYAKLDCSQTTVLGSGNDLTITWSITFKSPFTGTKNTYLRVTDDTNLSDYKKVGTWTITNQAPSVGTITPSSGTSFPNQAITFTTTYLDPDTWLNIQYTALLINTSTSGTNCFYGAYDQNSHKLYLRNDANTNWLGGYAPGSANIIENSYVKLDYSQTTVSGSGTNLSISWAITFKSSFTGTKNSYLYVKDDAGSYQNLTQAGTWTITNQAPTVGTITPSSGSSLPDQAVSFTTTYSDPDGWQNIQSTALLINTSTNGANSFYGLYDQNNHKLYLRNDANTNWLGGYAPGSANIIENSYAKLDCSKVTGSASGTTLTIKWNVTFKSTFTGLKNTYLYVKDEAGSYNGWIQKGTWDIYSGSAETEPNNDFTSSNIIQSDSPIAGAINPLGDQDYFKITTLQAGKLYIYLTNVPSNIDAYINLYDGNYNYITSGYSGGYGNNVILDIELSSAGDYYIQIFDYGDDAYSPSPYNLEVKFRTFWIYNLYDSPDPFSPNNDNQSDTTTISASITASSNWTINIKDSSSVIKRTFTGTGLSISQVWDGKDSLGAVVADGTYTYYIDAIDPVTNISALQVSGQVTLDNTLPTGSITEPLANATLSGTVAIKGTAQDTNFWYAYLSYGRGTNPTSWNYISYPPQTGPNPGLLANWNTTSLTNDDYILRLEVYDSAGNKTTFDQPVKLYNVNIYNVSDSPDPFSPNNDNNKDSTTITASITASSNWTINIKDSSNNIKRTFTGTGTSINQVWDGKDSLGAVVADGIYTYTIDAVDPLTGSTALQVSGQVTLDNTLPTGSITEPLANATLSGTVAIKGTAQDTNFSWWELLYGRGTTPTSWNWITSSGSQIGPTPGLLANWTTTSLTNDDYILRLEVYDTAGNKTTVDLPVKLYNVNIYNVSDSPDPFSPNNDNNKDSTTITASITASSNWTINIKDSSSVIKRTFTGTGTSISQVWDGKDSLGAVVADATYTYTIDAVDPLTGSTALQVSGQVTVDNTLPTGSITEPLANATLSGTVAIKGTAQDTNFYYAYLYYGRGTLPTQWNYLSYIGSPVGPTPGLFYNWNTNTRANDDYVIRLEIYDHANNKTTIDQPVKLYNVNIYNVSDSPDPFSPNNDNNKDSTTITASITASSNWTINIKDSSNNIKRTFTGTGTSINQVWDGKDSLGAVVADGIYTYTIDAVDPLTGSTALQVSGQVTLDNTLPTGSITEPLANATLSGTVAIKGTAQDTNFNYWNLYYGRGTTPTTWHGLTSSSSQIGPTPALLYNWNTTSLTNDDYVIRLEVYDKAGNVKVTDLPVNVCQTGSYYVEPKLFSPNNDGVKDTTHFVGVLSNTVNWTFSIKDSSNTVIKDFSGTGTSVNQVWDGKDNLGTVVSDGVYTFDINVTDSSTGQNILTGTGNLEVDNTLPAANISSPGPNSEVTGTSIPIRGIANDLHYDGTKSVLSYGQGTSPTQWTTIANLTYPKPTDSILGYWYTSELKSGPYTLRLLVYDLAGNIKDTQILVNLYNVRIISCSDSPDPFTPDADGNKDTTIITASLSMILDWSITITDTTNTVIRNFSGSSDSISQVWDGKDSLGTVVADGRYNYKIEATDPARNISATPCYGTITVDTALPLAIITSPSENAMVSGSSVAILGTASDNNLTNYKVEYGFGASPTSWTLIKQSSTSVTNGTLATWDTFKVANGSYTIRLMVTDRASHTATVSVKVTVDNIQITNISASPQFINPTATETSTISYTLDRPANVDINIYQAIPLHEAFPPNRIYAMQVGTLVRRLLVGQPRSAGINSETWDGKDDTGQFLPEDTYIFTIYAQNASGSSGEYNPEYVLGVVTIVNISITASFNPYANEYAQITYTIPVPAWMTIKIGASWVDVGGEERTLIYGEPRDQGINVELWDGRANDGHILTPEEYDSLVGDAIILPENSIVIQAPSSLAITNFLAEAYLIYPNYDQVSTLSYRLTQNAVVTIKIYEPNGSYFRTITEGESQLAGSHSYEWDGKNDAGLLVSTEGNYSVQIQAKDLSSGITAVWTGSVVVYR